VLPCIEELSDTSASLRKSLQDVYQQQLQSLESFQELLSSIDLSAIKANEDPPPPPTATFPIPPVAEDRRSELPATTDLHLAHVYCEQPAVAAEEASEPSQNNLVLSSIGEAGNAPEAVIGNAQVSQRVSQGHGERAASWAGYGLLSGGLVRNGTIWRKILIQSQIQEDPSVEANFYLAHQCWCGLWTRLRFCCYRLVSKKWFEYLMGLVIIANAVTVGYEIQASLTQPAEWIFAVDLLFVMIYVAELSIRFLAWGHRCFSDPWIILDMLLVIVGVASLVVTNGMGLELPELESLMVVRSLRLLRLIRALRLLKQFRTVWRLVSGLLTSANAMLSTLVLVLLTLYIAACLGIEVITKDETLSQGEATSEIVSSHFGSLYSTLLTLSAFVTLDSIASIYSPLITQKPSLGFYFFFIILFVSVALMNLVTAVLVEGALANASADKELEKIDLRERLKSQMPRLVEIFSEIDKDGSGTLTMEEMSLVPVDIIPEELLAKSNVGSMHDVFDVLDVDGGGELTREEFVDGLLNMFLHEVPFESVQMLRMMRSIDSKLLALGEEVRQMRLNGWDRKLRSYGYAPSESSAELYMGSA